MNPEETHNDFNSLVASYLSGELRPEQEREFKELLRKDPKKASLFEEIQNIWNSAGSLGEGEAYNLDAEWSLMQNLIPDLKSERQVKQSEVKTRSLIFYTYRIAYGYWAITKSCQGKPVQAGNKPSRLFCPSMRLAVAI